MTDYARLWKFWGLAEVSDSAKYCRHCDTLKSESDFHRGRAGLRKSICKSCHLVKYGRPNGARKIAAYRADRGPLLHRRSDKLFCPLEQTCKSCGLLKSYDEFSVNRDRRRTTCRSCLNERWRLARLEGRHPSRFKYRTDEAERARRVLASQRCNQKRAAIIASRSDGSITAEVLARLFATAKACAYCQAPFARSADKSLDHIVPLSRGGEHSIGNVCICCKRCNTSKGMTELSEWRERQGVVLTA
jgi:5-methylcytosine-specific restriction endonuclease McrA